MKRFFLPVAILLILLLPDSSVGSDINELEPVEAIQILSDADGVRVITDTGSSGYGDTLVSALENLHSSSNKRIFLETAQFLLVEEERFLDEMMDRVRPSCQICMAKGQTDLTLAVEYLKVHGGTVSLLEYRVGKQDLAIIYSKEGRSQIVG